MMQYSCLEGALLGYMHAYPLVRCSKATTGQERDCQMDNQQQQRINEAAQQFTNALVAAYTATSDRTVAAQEIGAELAEYFFNTVINNLRTQGENTRQMTQQLADQQQRAQEATRELTRASTDTYMELLDSVFSFYPGGTSRTQRRIEEAERREEEAQRRAEEAEERAEEAERNTNEAQRRTEQAEGSTEEAERRVEQAEGRAEEAERRAEDAESRVEEAERSTEEAGKSGSEAESQGGGELPLADYDSLNVRQISERLNELSVEEVRRLRDYEVRNKNRRTLVNRLNSTIEASTS
jgi:chromosome segregation ATPase